MFYLIKFSHLWRDEILCEGFAIITKNWWIEHFAEVPDEKFIVFFSDEVDYFFTFENKYHYKEHFQFIQLTDNEAKILQKFFVYDVDSEELPEISPNSKKTTLSGLTPGGDVVKFGIVPLFEKLEEAIPS